jgi:hypothetical protein
VPFLHLPVSLSLNRPAFQFPVFDILFILLHENIVNSAN